MSIGVLDYMPQKSGIWLGRIGGPRESAIVSNDSPRLGHSDRVLTLGVLLA